MDEFTQEIILNLKVVRNNSQDLGYYIECNRSSLNNIFSQYGLQDLLIVELGEDVVNTIKKTINSWEVILDNNQNPQLQKSSESSDIPQSQIRLVRELRKLTGMKLDKPLHNLSDIEKQKIIDLLDIAMCEDIITTTEYQGLKGAFTGASTQPSSMVKSEAIPDTKMPNNSGVSGARPEKQTQSLKSVTIKSDYDTHHSLLEYQELFINASIPQIQYRNQHTSSCSEDPIDSWALEIQDDVNASTRAQLKSREETQEDMNLAEAIAISLTAPNDDQINAIGSAYQKHNAILKSIEDASDFLLQQQDDDMYANMQYEENDSTKAQFNIRYVPQEDRNIAAEIQEEKDLAAAIALSSIDLNAYQANATLQTIQKTQEEIDLEAAIAMSLVDFNDYQANSIGSDGYDYDYFG